MATPLNLRGGGTVPSHESSMRNLAKARARWRRRRPWRSCDESRIIRRYAFLGYTARGKDCPVVTGLCNSVSATHGFRSWFGNLPQTQAKCGGYRQREAIPDLQNSAGRESTVIGISV
jgi:hypothetical protein